MVKLWPIYTYGEENKPNNDKVNKSWNILTHPAASVSTISENGGVNVVLDNTYVKNATEIAIPFSGMTRGNVLHIVRGPATGYAVSTYTAKSGYTLSYNCVVSFGQGYIVIGCSANTWGLEVIPVRVDANTIKWR